MDVLDIRFFDADKNPTDNPDLVVFIWVPCQCGLGYLWTEVGPVKTDYYRTWDGNMQAPTIDGSFAPAEHECHFEIEYGRYKGE